MLLQVSIASLLLLLMLSSKASSGLSGLPGADWQAAPSLAANSSAGAEVSAAGAAMDVQETIGMLLLEAASAATLTAAALPRLTSVPDWASMTSEGSPGVVVPATGAGTITSLTAGSLLLAASPDTASAALWLPLLACRGGTVSCSTLLVEGAASVCVALLQVQTGLLMLISAADSFRYVLKAAQACWSMTI